MGGVWELTAINRMPIGAGDKYALGDTGGEETHTLTVDEMPKHQHSDRVEWANSQYSGQPIGITWNQTSNLIIDKHLYGTGYTGGSQPHNNMPPYQAFYIWKRIA